MRSPRPVLARGPDLRLKEAEDIEAPAFRRGIGVRAAQLARGLPGRAKKSPVARALGASFFLLDRLDVHRLVALRARGHVEGHLLALLQGLEAASLDRREVGEQILAAAVRSDDAEALGIVEPLDRTCTHLRIS